MKNTIYCLILMCGFISTSAFAVCSGDRCIGKVTRVYMPNTSPQIVFIGTEGDESLLNCTAVSGVFVTLKGSHINFAEIYTALLAGQHSQNSMTIKIAETTQGCTVSYVSSDS